MSTGTFSVAVSVEQFHDLFRGMIDQCFQNLRDSHQQEYVTKARALYQRLTGEVHEESSFFETKMNLFNFWFLEQRVQDIFENHHLLYAEKYQQVYPKADDFQQLKIWKLYLNTADFHADIIASLEHMQYSLFQFLRTSFRGSPILYNWFNGKKYFLSSSYKGKVAEYGLEKGDLFVGRVAPYLGCYYLLPGFFFIPFDAKKQVVKAAKNIKRGKANMSTDQFLLKTESLKCRSLVYPHLPASKIFLYN